MAAGTQYWLRLRRDVAAGMTWLGIAGILIAATLFTASTPYPGWAAILPVAGAALIIVGGMSAGGWGAEVVLGTARLPLARQALLLPVSVELARPHDCR